MLAVNLRLLVFSLSLRTISYRFVAKAGRGLATLAKWISGGIGRFVQIRVLSAEVQHVHSRKTNWLWAKTQSLRDIIFCVDQSVSMTNSVVYSRMIFKLIAGFLLEFYLLPLTT